MPNGDTGRKTGNMEEVQWEKYNAGCGPIFIIRNSLLSSIFSSWRKHNSALECSKQMTWIEGFIEQPARDRTVSIYRVYVRKSTTLEDLGSIIDQKYATRLNEMCVKLIESITHYHQQCIDHNGNNFIYLR